MIKIDSGDFFLTEPTYAYAEQIKEYRQEFLDAGCSMNGCGPLRKYENPLDYISECEKYKSPETVPAGYVAATQFLYIRKTDDRLVGMIQIRHYLSEYLAKYAGHIGFSIRPSEQRKGYGTSMLRAALLYCPEIGLDKILISCDEGNPGSEKTILNNGGVYESTVFEEEKDRGIKRFWVTV
ncbi:MAG: GNAT family N-acetyltransferase [Clostridiales bacterium]|nr:GNAT family N-acetyltransferase [Clostridiales bacterium]